MKLFDLQTFNDSIGWGFGICTLTGDPFIIRSLFHVWKSSEQEWVEISLFFIVFQIAVR